MCAMKILGPLLTAILLDPSSNSAFVARKQECSVAPCLSKIRLLSTLDAASVVDDGIVLDLEQEDIDYEKKQFNWWKAWYPVVPVEILDPEVPHRFQLLGIDLVIWKDGAIEGGKFGSKKNRPKKAQRVGGEWRVFADECPHRKVPLSEGRVEDDGTLLCSYHGFRFDGDGACVDIPQISKDKSFSLERLQKNPKSRCNAFPSQVIDGVLYVWPETGDNALLESALTPAKHFVEDNVNKDRLWKGHWNYRELPYSADYFLENVVDPAHVSVSHHGVVSRYNDQSVTVTQNTPVTKDGFSVDVRAGTGDSSTISFHAPNYVEIKVQFSKDSSQILELLVSPSRPGFSNHVGRMVMIKDKDGAMPKLLKKFTFPIPKWLNHVMAASFLNQDAVFLHYQERQLAKTGTYVSSERSKTNHKYSENMFLTKPDNGVVKFRNWLSKRAGGFIPYKNGGSLPVADPAVCFDQYHSHTAKCQYCQGALKNFKKIRLASFVVSICFAILRPAPKQALNLIGALATASLGLGINKVIDMFHKNDYSHSHND